MKKTIKFLTLLVVMFSPPLHGLADNRSSQTTVGLTINQGGIIPNANQTLPISDVTPNNRGQPTNRQSLPKTNENNSPFPFWLGLLTIGGSLGIKIIIIKRRKKQNE